MNPKQDVRKDFREELIFAAELLCSA